MVDNKGNLPHNHFIHAAYNHKVLRAMYSKIPTIHNLVYPIFVSDDPEEFTPMKTLPGQARYGYKKIVDALKPLVAKGLKSVLIFGVLSKDSDRDAKGSLAGGPTVKGPTQLALAELTAAFPDLYLICDVCLCAFTSHGHCGLFSEKETLDNEASIKRLAEVAISYVDAGAHMVAPSDMMDGRIAEIKNELKLRKLEVPVMSYSTKFASKLYGPFRDVCKSAPKFGDRRGYQLPLDSKEIALKAAERDIQEGADFLMVKPISAYLDIASELKSRFNAPLACYHVSGEYAMICFAAESGAIDKKGVVLEYMRSFRRAGIDMIITYFVPELLDWLKEEIDV